MAAVCSIAEYIRTSLKHIAPMFIHLRTLLKHFKHSAVVHYTSTFIWWITYHANNPHNANLNIINLDFQRRLYEIKHLKRLQSLSSSILEAYEIFFKRLRRKDASVLTFVMKTRKKKRGRGEEKENKNEKDVLHKLTFFNHLICQIIFSYHSPNHVWACMSIVTSNK